MKRYYKVSIVQASIKQYRESFYLKLWEHLAQFGVNLSVVYSNPGRIELSKRDTIDLPTTLAKKVPRLYFLNDRILMQFLSTAEIAQSDLVIIDQATGYLHNYPLLFLSRLGLKKVAFWGHGQNRQGNPRSLSEIFKRRLVNWTDWWFAYTRGTADYLTSVGVLPNKITPIENAIDTQEFRGVLESVTHEEIVKMRSNLRICDGDRVGIYCGSLYTEKRVQFLLNAAIQIAANLSGFRLIVVGGGRETDTVQRASDASPCIIHAGPFFGRDKAICFKMAEISIHPGAVGLGILDSFTAGLPFVTTCEALHGPEIDYLENGVNGLMVAGDEEAFAKTIVDLIREPDRLALLRLGAMESADRYTVENMVKNISKGILACLGIDLEAADIRSA